MLNKIKVKNISENQKIVFKNRLIVAIALGFFWLTIIIASIISSTDVLSRIFNNINIYGIRFAEITSSSVVLIMLLPLFVLSYYEINKIYFEKIISITYLENSLVQKFNKFVKINMIVNKKSFFILTGFMTLSFLISTIALIVRTVIINSSNNVSVVNDLSIILFISMIISALIWFSTVFFLLWKFKIDNFRDIFTFFLITFMTVAGFISIFYIAINQGIGVLVFLLVIVVSADTFAYIGGLYFGKKKISPKISPNKTVEGFLIGFFLSILMAMGVAGFFYYIDTITVDSGKAVLNNGQNLLDSLIFGMYSSQPILSNSIIIDNIIVKNIVSFVSVFLLAATLSIVTSIGDIFFSYIKRAHDIKDYSTILKEHGGVLDRFDSILFSSTFYIICFFIILIALEFMV